MRELQEEEEKKTEMDADNTTPVLRKEVSNLIDVKDYGPFPGLPNANVSHANDLYTPNGVSSTTTTDQTLASAAKESSPLVRIVGHALRTLILDLPLVAVLLTFAATLWVHHVHDAYLEPQLDAVLWTVARSGEEITYYQRECDVTDMTTHRGADLFLSPDATPEEAYQHQLLHGFSVFPSVLSPDAATNLRKFVLSRNRNLTEEESIFVIAGENRFSFGLGTEEPSVTAAMMDLANNDRLRPALEKIIGPNPSLIEMTAITSSYGAEAQYWHDDVIPTASAIKYARSFGPSYSVFVMLQNTTAGMGATAACPGTHYCSAGDIADYCEEEGFQLVGDDGHWRIGDGLLMNMNSVHRGAAYVDPDGEDRVMLILTFAPRPNERAESRQMSQGITFSLRWDMWGHTLDDLAHADTAMAQPWATLRALGLYKLPGYEWGIDYISGASMRMSNGDNSFYREELDTFLELGGIKWLPQFLHGQVTDTESWHEFCLKTLLLCEDFAKRVSVFAITGYLVLFSLFGLVSGKPHRLPSFGRATCRLALICGAVSLVFLAAKRKVDNTGWAADIRSDLRYSSAVETEQAFDTGRASGPTTLPTRKDVLIETRHGSEFLAMYNDFVDGHPGNRFFLDLIKTSVETFQDYPEEFRNASARYIATTIAYEQSRFLVQGLSGDWHVLMEEDAIFEHIKKELLVGSNPILKKLRQAIAFISSDYKYGIYRKTALAEHAVPYLRRIEALLLEKSKGPAPKEKLMLWGAEDEEKREPAKRTRLFRLPSSSTGAKRAVRRSRSASIIVPQEPYLGAWLKEGDTVETFDEGFWYLAIIDLVTAHGYYTVSYPDGSNGVFEDNAVRAAQRYAEGEHAEALLETPEGTFYYTCEIVEQLEDESYHVIFEDDGRHYAGFGADLLRRSGNVLPKGMYEAAY